MNKQGKVVVTANRSKKYVPHTKGGPFRKWYGNYEYVIKFDSNSYKQLLNSGNHLPSRQYYFLEGASWTRVSSKFAVRYSPKGMVFNSACPTIFDKDSRLLYTIGLLNSVVVNSYTALLSPTINFQSGDIGKIPYVFEAKKQLKVSELVKRLLEISQMDWDSFETSWNFKRHPLI